MERIYRSPDDSGGGGSDFVAEASAMGWVPEEKWTGAKEKWVDAKTFVERGTKVLPIVLQRNKELEAKVRELGGTVEQIKADAQAFKEMIEASSKRDKEALQAQYEEALKARSKAVTEGDGVKFEEADRQAKELEAEATRLKAEEEKRKQTAATKTETVTPHPDFAAWQAKNPWFEEGTDAFDEANAIALLINQKRAREGGKPLNGLPLFTEVEKTMKKRHPELKDTDERGTVVENGDGTRGDEDNTRRGKAKTYENLPLAAKQACDRFIKNGLISDKQGKTLAEKRAAYCANYDWEG